MLEIDKRHVVQPMPVVVGIQSARITDVSKLWYDQKDGGSARKNTTS